LRAIRAQAAGGPEVLSLDELPLPEPGPGEARVRLDYAGVNFIDVYLRTGLYDPGPRPAPLGREGTGVVTALGPGAADVRPGERVAFVDGRGSYAEEAIVRADRLLPVDDELPAEAAAALPLQGMTADYLVRTIGRVEAGDVVLVHAAAGGVGRLAVQMAKAAGARVLGTCSTPEKAERARTAGCDRVIRYDETDFAEAALDATGGRGCDLVLDSVGRATFARSVRATRVRGTLVVFGQSSGLIEPVSPRPALGSRTLVSATLFDYVRDREELLQRWRRVSGEVLAGRLQLAIDRVLPLEHTAEAHRLLESRATAGKLLLDCR
jgi:NADPH2:quinone reductase